MADSSTTPLFLASPFGWVGRQVLAVLAYLGGMVGVLTTSARSLLQRGAGEPSMAYAVSTQLGWIFVLGLPMVALVHVGLGSFLSMQSYFGGTFVEGTGAVVGVGLLRNVAALMACLTMAGLIAARMTPELRAKRRATPAQKREAPVVVIERAAPVVRPAGPNSAISDRDVAARLIATTVAGPVLSFWGALVGTAVGWQVAQTLLGVSTNTFFSMFWEMIWVRDVIGLAVKGLLFGLFSGLFACHEGLRGVAEDDLESVSSAAGRAACLSGLAILVINSGWFILMYHAGPAFGPTLLAPATP